MRAMFFVLFLVVCGGAQAKRIVALSPHLVENLYVIGAGEQLVGTLEHADYPEEAKAVPRIGGYYGVQMEKLLALKPDLVLVWQGGNRAEDIAKMRELGLKVVLSKTERIEELPDQLRELGRLTGRRARAEQVAAHVEQRLQALRQRYQDAEPLDVFYQLWPDPMMTVGKNTLISRLVEICGGRNVFADSATDYPQISMENLMAAAPQAVVIPDEQSGESEAKFPWAAWPDIPAVKSGNLIHVNGDLLHRFSPRLLDGLEELCRKMDTARRDVVKKIPVKTSR